MAMLLGTMMTAIGDYALTSNDERVMFDWLIWNCSNHLKDGYRHSIPQIQDETKIARHSQEKIISKFEELGFLEVQNTMYKNSRYRTFFVAFGILAKDEVLSKIFHKDSTLYRANKKAFFDLDKLQRSRGHPF